MTDSLHRQAAEDHGVKLSPIISREQIEQRLDEMAAEIRRDYAGRELAVIAVMKGAIFFLVDLLRRLDMPVRLDLTYVASYEGAESNGKPQMLMPIAIDLRGRHVLIVDDVLDTGLTLRRVLAEVGRQRPESVRICVLLDKTARRRVDVRHDYCGFEIGGEFVVGYGLDYNGLYRNLPYIAVMDEG